MKHSTLFLSTPLRRVFILFFPLFLSHWFGLPAFAQNTAVQGTVLNEQGGPVSGASVLVKGTKSGVTTDANGRFSINAQVGQTLVFTTIGFNSREVVIQDLSPMSVNLTANSSAMNEVVVVGYSTQRRTSLTSAISSVSGSEIVTTKNENILNSLAGKVPGLRIVQNTSEPGAFSTSFDIRGMGAPLIVIDGIPRPDIARVDPNDVETLSVMKDASAAVYGARAANGVILITTKKGRRGTMELNYVGTQSLLTPIGFPKSVNAADYMTLVNEQAMRAMNPRVYTDAQIEEYRNGTKQSTDWQKATINRNATQTQHNLSATGGNENSNFFISAGYTGHNGILKSGDLFYRRYNIRSNLSTRINKNLSFDLNLSAIMERKDQPMEPAYWAFRSMWYQPPINPVYANNNPMYLNTLPNPLHPVGQSTTEIGGGQVFNNKWFQSSANITYKVPFIPGLSVKGLYSFDYTLNNNKIFRKTYTTYTYNPTTNTYAVTGTQQSPSTVRRELYEYPTTLGQFSLNYNHSFANTHNIGALVLYEQSNRRGDNFFAQRELAIPIDQLFGGNSLNQQGSMQSSINNSFDYKNAAYVGFATYDYKSKYFAKFAFRYDGSSRFAPSNQYGFFPVYEVGWRLSQEKFFQNFNALAFINSLKFRASYGKTGDEGILRYQFLTGYQYPASGSATGQPPGAVFNGVFVNAVQNTGIANPGIFWSTSTMFDVGVDIEAWNGKFGFTFDYFKRDRTGLLATRQVTVPDVVGASFPAENLNSDRNEGFDFEITHRNRIGQFNFDARGTFSYTRIMNRYVERAKSGNSYLNWMQNNNNRYAGVYFGYGANGQFESYDAIQHSPIYVNRLVIPGDWRYEDWNGDGQVGVDDSHPIANTGMPLVQFGLSLNGSFKGLDVNLLFQGATMVRATYLEQLGGPLWANGSSLEMFMDRWHPEDPNADPYSPTTKWVQGNYAYTGNNAFTNTLHNVKDATYVRLKSAEIGYTLPAKLTSRIGIRSLRIFGSGYNVFTITGLKYLDPEHPSQLSAIDSQFGYAYPIDRVISLGLNIKF